jgi:hypothetical protein
VEDGDDDLLGGDADFTSAPAQPSGGAAVDDLDDFESSFPAIDTRNYVCLSFRNLPNRDLKSTNMESLA